jgi:hypothetical protein
MSDINSEIDQVAETLEKSTRDPKVALIETIRTLGPAGIRAKLPTLEKSEQILLISTLEEMKKAVEMDKNYAAKFVQGKVTDTIIQEDKADDDQDEKLVLEAATTINHQGTPTPGWEGQVIKGEPMKKEVTVEAGKPEDTMMDAKKKVKSGDKDKMKEGLKFMKKSVEDALGDKATPELVKSGVKKLLAEESQDGDAPEMNEKTRATKESVPAIELGKDNKKNMTKSVGWTGENDLLKACTNGRNHHFSMEDYINEVLADAAKPAETIAKSQTEKKDDLNDIIEKGGDTTWGAINCEKMIKANVANQRGTLVKSFETNEIAEALGLSPEEAKKILGE